MMEKSFTIDPETPMPGKSIIVSMQKGETVKIQLDFGSGDPSIHTFSLSGFTKAYKMLPACSGIPIAKQKKVDSLARVSQATLTLASFLTSKFSKKYGISKQDGWQLKNGLFNNSLSVSSLQGAMLEVSTRGSNIVEAGVMFLGTSSLDASKMSFILGLLKTFDSSIYKPQIKKDISKGLLRRVNQINLAPIRTYGSLRIRVATVGVDAVISIELQ